MVMSLAIVLKVETLFGMLGCVMVATLVYTISIDGLPLRKDLLTPFFPLSLLKQVASRVLVYWSSYQTWVFYKESNWIRASLWVLLLVCFGRDGMEHERRVSVVTARIFFSALGCLMLGTLVYTLLTDGSPFRRELLTPWMHDCNTN